MNSCMWSMVRLKLVRPRRISIPPCALLAPLESTLQEDIGNGWPWGLSFQLQETMLMSPRITRYRTEVYMSQCSGLHVPTPYAYYIVRQTLLHGLQQHFNVAPKHVPLQIPVLVFIRFGHIEYVAMRHAFPTLDALGFPFHVLPRQT